MPVMHQLYGAPPALLTDLYQLTMAYAHWKSADPEREAVFHLFFRDAPFSGQFAIACGMQAVQEYVCGLRFQDDDIAYLQGLEDAAGEPLFPPEFLDYLARLRFTGDIHAVAEGTAVFPHTPILRVRAPVLQAQLLETALLNLVNYPTLIATKAARMAHAAQGDPVLDFGLRKAHGIDGGVTASRAAYLGGCAATANLLAGKLYGIPVKGTHAHGWVMAFDSEREAFDKFARALPNNCIFLVDTYDSLQGVENAIAVGRELRERGFEMAGLRLDSGDLGELAKTARRMLDEAGFEQAKIAASSSLDEHRIAELKNAGAPIVLWGVGTRLTTGQPDATLDGVYKLAAIRDSDGEWQSRIKLSDTPEKQTHPGTQQTRRFYRDGVPVMDVIFDQGHLGADWSGAKTLAGEDCELPTQAQSCDLLAPIVSNGQAVSEFPELAKSRAYAMAQYAQFESLDSYPVALESRLATETEQMRAKLRQSLAESDNA